MGVFSFSVVQFECAYQFAHSHWSLRFSEACN